MDSKQIGAEDWLSSICQDGRPPLSVEEFVESSHLVSWSDRMLSVCFQMGLDEGVIWFLSPDRSLSFVESINLVFWLNGSDYIVEDVPHPVLSCKLSNSPKVYHQNLHFPGHWTYLLRSRGHSHGRVRSSIPSIVHSSVPSSVRSSTPFRAPGHGSVSSQLLSSPQSLLQKALLHLLHLLWSRPALLCLRWSCPALPCPLFQSALQCPLLQRAPPFSAPPECPPVPVPPEHPPPEPAPPERPKAMGGTPPWLPKRSDPPWLPELPAPPWPPEPCT
ncbi:Titin [Labeo rohita]|uniref:Titin n=1 Tax=Labeo rohita TaxID=84645 RepID=A0ABQ8M6S9_LABRO|nr:Titin [Labeo rohita]